ncbi:uncharacterized protein LOC132162875 [Corylus avellana]|uniref:uncharacterized protein LOC132162875 n=1 Tax=Corylus avellana TaxID=13451 RepID=UPI00286ABDF8|nr:uncharacterized protein LOC132162875 [Corylus avellana]
MGLLDPAAAEATTSFLGVNLCKYMGIHSLIVEGDTQVVITAVQKQDPTNSRYDHLVEDTRTVMSSFLRWQVCHLSRDANKTAHGLAKAATRDVINRNLIDMTPDCICDIVLTELSTFI